MADWCLLCGLVEEGGLFVFGGGAGKRPREEFGGHKPLCVFGG